MTGPPTTHHRVLHTHTLASLSLSCFSLSKNFACPCFQWRICFFFGFTREHFSGGGSLCVDRRRIPQESVGELLLSAWLWLLLLQSHSRCALAAVASFLMQQNQKRIQVTSWWCWSSRGNGLDDACKTPAQPDHFVVARRASCRRLRGKAHPHTHPVPW